MKTILYLIFYAAIALLIMSRFSEWLNLHQNISGLIGIGVGPLCVVAAAVTDLIIERTRK